MVGAHRSFWSGATMARAILYPRGTLSSSGAWVNVTNRYLGLKFRFKHELHFGWARLSVKIDKTAKITVTLTGYAYETLPNRPIIAGKTHDEDDVDPGSGASLTNPIPDIPRPATLGLLALGSPGLPIWRRKESVGAGE